jgi:hypothetical protein
MLGGAPSRWLQQCAERAELHRLRQVLVCACSDGSDRGFDLSMPRQHHEDRVWSEGAPLLDELDAIQFGHLQIGQNHVGTGVQQRQRARPVLSGFHAETLGKQRVLQRTACAGVVLRDDNFRLFAIHG